MMAESEQSAFILYLDAVIKSLHWIVAAMFLSAGAMLLWLTFVSKPQYTAHMVVAPYTEDSSSDRSVTGAGVLAMLASGSGLGGGANFGIYIQTRDSLPVAERLLRDPDVPEHFYRDFWDSQTRTWQRPEGALADIILGIKRIMGFPEWSPPDASDLVQLLDLRVKSTQDMQQGSYTYTFTDEDPQFAASLLRRIHDYSEEHLRQQALQRTTLQIQHLVAELGKNTIAENRQVLTQILLQQQQERSRINPAIPFSTVVVDPAQAPHRPSTPRPVLYLLMSLVIPAILGVLLAILPVANPSLVRAMAQIGRKLRHPFTSRRAVYETSDV